MDSQTTEPVVKDKWCTCMLSQVLGENAEPVVIDVFLNYPLN
jgi:hypothetical protein